MISGKPHTQVNIWIENDDVAAAILTDFDNADEIIDFLKDFIIKIDKPVYREYLNRVCAAQKELEILKRGVKNEIPGRKV